MKIISLSVVAFGKLKNVNLQFKNGLNVIKNDNGFGKTTLAGFIRAMLYGFNYTRTKGVTDASHYAPWGSNDKFGGSMVVEHEGTCYRIERFFGLTARQETLSVTNNSTGKAVNVIGQPGEMFLGLTADSYDRSAYFPQEAVELSSNDNFETRLANLVEDSAEDFDKVQEKLRNYKKNLRYERGVGGEIYQLDCQKQELNRQLNEAQYAERRAVEIDKRLAEIEQDKATLNERRTEFSEQLTRLQSAVREAQSERQPLQPEPPKQTKNNKLLLFLGIALAFVGIVFLVLGVTQVLRVVGYYVGVASFALGVIAVVVYFVYGKRAKRDQVEETPQIDRQQDYATVASTCINELSALNERMNSLATETGRLTEERKGLVFNNVEIVDKLLAVEEKRKDAIHRYEVADEVVKLLNQAKDNLSSSYLPKLCARTSSLLQEITHSDLSVAVDRDFTISIREMGQTRRFDEFSRGIREITLLSFRVALSELLYDGAIPFVIIDDAFVNFDEDNFLRATTLLKKLSTHAQIIYFTCHNRTGELLK